MPTVNAERLLSDLNHLRTFGQHGNGVIRPSLSSADRERPLLDPLEVPASVSRLALSPPSL